MPDPNNQNIQQLTQDPAQDPNLLGGPGDVVEIPEKYRVFKEDGTTLDEASTLKKIAKSHSEVEKMLGTAEAAQLKAALKEFPLLKELIADRPANESEYKLDYSKYPEGVKIDPEREKSFLKHMHGLGVSRKQAQGIMDRFGELLGEGTALQKNQIENTLVSAVQELHEGWGAEAEANIKAAQVGFQQLAEDDDKANVAQIGKDLKVTYKTLMRMLSKVGKDFQEDNPPGGDGLTAADNIDVLMKSEAYWNPSHPEHTVTVKKITEFYTKKHQQKG